LLPGSYDITISAPGYQTEVQSGVTLTVGGQQVLNLVMTGEAATQLLKIMLKFIRVAQNAPFFRRGYTRVNLSRMRANWR